MQKTILISVAAACVFLSGQAVMAKVDPMIARLMNVKPSPTNSLAAVRQSGLTNNGAGVLRSTSMKKLLSTISGPKRAEMLGYDPSSDFGIQPVAFVPAGYARPMVTAELNGARVRYVAEPGLGAIVGGLMMQSGTAIIEANDAMTVRLPEGRLELSRGAVVKVSALNGTYRVINIVDDGPDSVHLRVCRRHLIVRPGQEVRYSIDKELAAQHVHDGCGRRNEIDQSCCTYAIKVDDISIAALLKHDPIGRQVYASSVREDKLLAHRITKLAAALAFWTKAKNPYTWD